MMNCSTCKHYYIIRGKNGNVVDDGCVMEDEIPFFDREMWQDGFCEKWEEDDGKTEE